MLSFGNHSPNNNASFLTVALTAACRPFRNAIRLKKLDKWVSFKFPMAFTECRKAIFSRLLPLGILLFNIFPPDILLFGASRNQEQKCFAVSNFLNPSIPISLIIAITIAWLPPSTSIKSVPPKYWKAT